MAPKFLFSREMAGSSAEPIDLQSTDEDEDKKIDLGSTDEDEPKTKRPRVAAAAAQSSSSFVLVIVSDTHGKHEDVKVPQPTQFPNYTPVLIHCGDFESSGKLETWLTQPPQSLYPHKICICGNHDGTFKALDAERNDCARASPDYESALSYGLEQQQKIKGFRKDSLIKSAVLLHDWSVKLQPKNGDGPPPLLIYGSPYHTHDPTNNSDNNRWFERHESEMRDGKPSLRTIFAHIPNETDVLLTHAGPYGILDKTGGSPSTALGSSALKERIDALPHLAVHAFGHVHATQTCPNGYTTAVTVEATRKHAGEIVPVKKCNGKDVRAVKDTHGCIFANAAGAKVGAGDLRHKDEDDPSGWQRAPLVLKLDHDGTRWNARPLPIGGATVVD